MRYSLILRPTRCRPSFLALVAALAIFAAAVNADEPNRVMRPNYEQAAQYSTEYLRQFLYDTAVTPRWIGKTDQFWYSYRTSRGTHYYRVNPKLATKVPLFDQVKLASQLTELLQKPIDAAQLPLSRASMNDEGTKLKFVIDNFQYEYDLQSEKLAKLGKAPPVTSGAPPEGVRTREELERWMEERRRQQDEQRRGRDEQQRDDQQRDQNQDQERQDQQQDDGQRREQGDQERAQQQNTQQGETTGQGGASGTTGRRPSHRNFSSDRKAYVYAQGHNLYFVEVKEEEKKEEAKKAEPKAEDAKKEENKTDDVKAEDQAAKKEEDKKEDATKDENKKDEEAKKSEGKVEETKKSDESKPQEKPPEAKPSAAPPAEIDNDAQAVQVTTDGAEDYSFASSFGSSSSRGTSGSRETAAPIPPDRKTRPNVTWSKDSKSFYVTRSDSRGVKELLVINSLASPGRRWRSTSTRCPARRRSARRSCTISIATRRSSPASRPSGRTNRTATSTGARPATSCASSAATACCATSSSAR